MPTAHLTSAVLVFASFAFVVRTVANFADCVSGEYHLSSFIATITIVVTHIKNVKTSTVSPSIICQPPSVQPSTPRHKAQPMA
jgi:thiamine transporter ThiT